jgi:hypothetical protein
VTFALGGAKAATEINPSAPQATAAEVNLLGLSLMTVAVVMDGMEMALRVELFSPKVSDMSDE